MYLGDEKVGLDDVWCKCIGLGGSRDGVWM